MARQLRDMEFTERVGVCHCYYAAIAGALARYAKIYYYQALLPLLPD